MKRPPGRPPLDPADRSVPVTVLLPSRQLKALTEEAKSKRTKLHDLIRSLLRSGPTSNKNV